MLLLGALLALLAVGLWMYALIDVLLTPEPECRGLAKQVWLGITGLLLVAGAMAWLLFGRPNGRAGRSRRGIRSSRPYGGFRDLPPDAMLRRHPASRGRLDDLGWADEEQTVPPARVVGPDDDPDFLCYLDRVISDIREAGNGA